MYVRRSMILVLIVLFGLTLVMAGPAKAIDCEDCTWLTSIDITDIDGNTVFDADDVQIVEFGESGPAIKVTLNYEITEETPLPCKVICVIKGPSGETFMKKRRIKEAGQYKYTAKGIFVPTTDPTATIEYKLKVRKGGLGLLGKDVGEVDITVGSLE
jgi:hypothetical protein